MDAQQHSIDQNGVIQTPAPSVPDHELIRPIGSGAYGEIWLARNVLGIHRAVKVIYRSRFRNADPYEREFNGIKSYEPVSRSNEGLIDILQVGRNDEVGYFYYVMELADDFHRESLESETERQSDGRVSDAYVPHTLSEELQRRKRLPVPECVQIMLPLSLALGHLHRHGLLHRDIKPSNIIFIHGVPKLADIGLVTGETEAQSYVGTLGFIPPEGPNSRQADIYGLGKVLYEMGMGKDRKEFPEPATLLWESHDREPLAELNAVILKACAANPSHRYATIEAMHEDLALLQNQKSVRRKHLQERRIRQLRRLGAVAAAAGLVGLVGFLYQREQTGRVRTLMQQVKAESEKAQHSAILASEEAERSRENLQRLYHANGIKEMEDGRPARALHWVSHALSATVQGTEEAGLLAQTADLLIRRFPTLKVLRQLPGPSVYRAGFFFQGGPSPIRPQVLLPQADDVPVVVDLYTGRTVFKLDDESVVGAFARYSDDGHWIITCSGEGPTTVQVWNAFDGGPASPPIVHAQRVNDARVATLGAKVATSERPSDTWSPQATQTIRVWDVSTGEECIPALDFNDLLFPVFMDFHPLDNRLLVSVQRTTGDGGEIWAYDPSTGEGGPTGIRQDAWFEEFEFIADGRQILVNSSSKGNWGNAQPAVWDLVDEAQLYSFPLGPELRAISSADGRTIVCHAGNQLSVWDARNGNVIIEDLRADGDVTTTAISPDNRILAAGTQTGKVHLWDLEYGTQIIAPINHSTEVLNVKFSHDGRFLYSVTVDMWARIWDLGSLSSHTTNLQIENWGKAHFFFETAYSKHLVAKVSDNDGRSVVVWDTETLTRLWSDRIVDVAVSENGEVMATVNSDGQIHLRDIETGETTGEPCVIGDATGWRTSSFQLSPNGRWLIMLNRTENMIRLWDVREGFRKSEVLIHEHTDSDPEGIGYVAFSPDERMLVSARGHQLWVWDLQTGDPIAVQDFSMWSRPEHLQFGPEGKRFLVVQGGRLISCGVERLRDPAPFQASDFAWMRITMPGGGLVNREMTKVLTQTGEGQLQVQDLFEESRTADRMVHGALVGGAAFAPTEPRIVTGGADGSLRLWDSQTGVPIGSLFGHGNAIMQIRFGQESKNVITCDQQGTLLIESLEPSGLATEEFEIWAQAHSGVRLGEDGSFRSLTAEDIQSSWRALEAILPNRFQLKKEDRVRWHVQQLQTSDLPQSRNTPLFHARQLAALQPDREEWQKAVERIESRGFPPRSPDTPARLIDLSQFYNFDFRQGMVGLPSYSWKNLPVGVHTLAGVAFDIRGKIHLISEQNRLNTLHPKVYPEQMNGVPVGMKAACLHFLHTASYGEGEADPHTIGKYVIHYADGSKVDFDIVFNQNIAQDLLRPEHAQDIELSEQTRIAWTGTSTFGETRGQINQLYATKWLNPHPEKSIASIDMINLPTKASFSLFAITAEQPN